MDQTNASIVKNDVRMGWEVDAISAKTSSTTQDTRANAQGRIIGNKHRKGLGTGHAVFVEMDVGPVSPSSTTGYELSRAETPQTFLRFCLCLYLPK